MPAEFSGMAPMEILNKHYNLLFLRHKYLFRNGGQALYCHIYGSFPRLPCQRRAPLRPACQVTALCRPRQDSTERQDTAVTARRAAQAPRVEMWQCKTCARREGGATILVASKAWCRDMKQRAQGDRAANQAADVAKHCLLG